MPTEVRYGTAGWSYPDWYGPFYPRVPPRAERASPGPLFGGDVGPEPDAAEVRLARQNPLAWYARWFDTVEVDSTFYRIPATSAVEKWVKTTDRASRPFLFCFKAPRTLTHEPRALTESGQRDAATTEARAFLEAIRPALEARRTGCVLLQFPWSFRHAAGNLERLARLVGALGDAPLVVEVRHASWDDGDAFAWFRDRGVSLAVVDQPRTKGSLGLVGAPTAALGYVRLHGRNHHAWWRGARERAPEEEKRLAREARAEGRPAPRDARYDYYYSEREVDELAARVAEVADVATRTFVIANNHFRGQAPANALELRARREGPPPVPATLARAYPRLAALARA